MTPSFITFTGADDRTSIDAMIGLSERWPIEWAILFSPSRQGADPRYPSHETLRRLAESSRRNPKLVLAAHLCGDHARAVMEGRMPDLPVPMADYGRIQVNHGAPEPAAIRRFSDEVGRPCIAQARGETFPDDRSILWLFDASGGRGIAPKGWPAHPGREVGYAGGIGPDNVAGVISAIGADAPYWIDMETGVRTSDAFDLAKVEDVCRRVYV